MKIAGIICEYDPFHWGHKYQIDKTRELLGDCGIVCLMSGDFTQRAQPAMFDKLIRAEAAVYGGADLVLELPVTAAIASAEGFALGGVRILEGMGCIDNLSFGSELGDINGLNKVVEAINSEDFSPILRSKLDSGLSFPMARRQAVSELAPDAAEALDKPNNILAVEYIKALKRLNSSIAPVTVKRTGSQHEETASAGDIRRRILAGEQWQELVAEKTAELIENELTAGKAPYLLENAERAVLYRLKTMTDSDYDALPYGSEGLGVKLQNVARREGSLNSIIEGTMSKRYPRSRIQRLVLWAFLGLTAQEPEPVYARVLAFNERGREIIKQSQFPLITNHSQIKTAEAKKYFELENRCSDLAQLCLPAGSRIGYGKNKLNHGKNIW